MDLFARRQSAFGVAGVGFSIEPGIYVPGEIGLRSEVNAHARADGLDVTPDDYQNELIVV